MSKILADAITKLQTSLEIQDTIFCYFILEEDFEKDKYQSSFRHINQCKECNLPKIGDKIMISHLDFDEYSKYNDDNSIVKEEDIDEDFVRKLYIIVDIIKYYIGEAECAPGMASDETQARILIREIGITRKVLTEKVKK